MKVKMEEDCGTETTPYMLVINECYPFIKRE
jgi:hypothetical protein